MLPYRPAPAPTGPMTPVSQLDIDQPLGGQVQSGLNLCLPLKAPVQMPVLLKLIKSQQHGINAALAGLNYVHFARFVPSPDGSILWVITTYDGDLEPYVMDFVGVLGDAFTSILYFIRGAPPLPVSRYPREFMDFIKGHNLPIPVWSAYPSRTVIDIEVLGGNS
jgi:hypothetical protein